MRIGLTVVTRLVAGAELCSIEGDLPEIIVSRYPIGPVLALSALSPRLSDWIIARMGVNDFFRRAAEAEKRPQRWQAGVIRALRTTQKPEAPGALETAGRAQSSVL